MSNGRCWICSTMLVLLTGLQLRTYVEEEGDGSYNSWGLVYLRNYLLLIVRTPVNYIFHSWRIYLEYSTKCRELDIKNGVGLVYLRSYMYLPQAPQSAAITEVVISP